MKFVAAGLFLATLNAHGIEDYTRAYVYANSDMDITSMSIKPMPASLADCEDIVLAPSDHGGIKAGRTSVRAYCGEQKGFILLDIKATIDVPVLISDVQRGDIITESMITHVAMESSRVRAHSLTDASMIIGKSARRNIGANDLMTRQMLESPKVIFRGDVADYLIEGRGFEINVKVDILQDGGVGDKVKGRLNGKNMVFTVVDHSTVKKF